MKTKLILILIILTQIIFGQSLLPVYKGEVEPKFELVWEIGGDTEDPDYLFERVWNININAKGNVFVVDDGQKLIKVFDKDGRFIKDFGRKGEGPGEFSSCGKLKFDKNENIFVYDISLRRLSMFSPAGKFIKSSKFKNSILNYEIISQDNILALTTSTKYDKSEPLTEYKIAHYNSEGKFIASIDSVMIKERSLSEVGGQLRVMTIIYHPKLLFELLSNGNLITCETGNFDIKLFGKEGKKIFENNYAGKKIKVSLSEREKIMAENKRYNPGMPDGILQINEFKPFNEYSIKDSEDYVLLKSYENENVFFDILKPDGTYLNKVNLPKEIFNKTTVIKNGFIFTEFINDKGFSSIRKYKITAY